MPALASHLAIGQKTLIMGVLNVTPDSFFDGGLIDSAKAGCERALQLQADGADLVDIGGESSRPGADPVSETIEHDRVFPLLDTLEPKGVPVSVDTYRASTARGAIDRGAIMINDITALRGDPDMAGVIAETGRQCVLMHMQGTPKTMQEEPRYADVVDDICSFFEKRIEYATREGIAEHAIWLDPGFGFGKTVAQNLEMLRRLREFKRLGRPILVGTSNKSTIGAVLDLPVDGRTEGTAATVAIAIANGADAVRVHDVKTMARVAKMSDAVIGREEE